MKRKLSQHTLTLLGVVMLAGALATAPFLAGANGLFTHQAAPAGQANVGPEDAKDEKEQNEPKDAGEPAKPKEPASVPELEVLCQRIHSGDEVWSFYNCQASD